MKTVTVREAKTTLSQLITDVEAGEEVIIMRGNKPAARLAPASVPAPKRVFGALAGKVVVTDEFFEPLPDDELAGWEE